LDTFIEHGGKGLHIAIEKGIPISVVRFQDFGLQFFGEFHLGSTMLLKEDMPPSPFILSFVEGSFSRMRIFSRSLSCPYLLKFAYRLLHLSKKARMFSKRQRRQYNSFPPPRFIKKQRKRSGACHLLFQREGDLEGHLTQVESLMHKYSFLHEPFPIVFSRYLVEPQIILSVICIDLEAAFFHKMEFVKQGLPTDEKGHGDISLMPSRLHSQGTAITLKCLLRFDGGVEIPARSVF
jgi:hypothetical protein